MAVQPLTCWRRRSALTLALVSGISGCGSTATLGEVDGVVSRGGKPLANVKVVFYPDLEAGGKGSPSVAYTDSAGHYRLSTNSGTTGAVVGMHRVCLFDLKAMDGPANEKKKRIQGGVIVPSAQQPLIEPPVSRVPPEYSAASDTPLRNIEVKPGKQTIDLPLPRQQ
jgi:hypothetical protein